MMVKISKGSTGAINVLYADAPPGKRTIIVNGRRHFILLPYTRLLVRYSQNAVFGFIPHTIHALGAMRPFGVHWKRFAFALPLPNLALDGRLTCAGTMKCFAGRNWKSIEELGLSVFDSFWRSGFTSYDQPFSLTTGERITRVSDLKPGRGERVYPFLPRVNLK